MKESTLRISFFTSLTIAIVGIVILIVGCCPDSCPASQQDKTDIDQFFYALATVESNHNDEAVGDGGASIGRYQIQKPYWIDATELSRIGGEYKDVKKKEYAEKCMIAYWKRYVPEAWEEKNWEVLAKVHNGGPKGHLKKATQAYWEKVKKHL